MNTSLKKTISFLTAALLLIMMFPVFVWGKNLFFVKYFLLFLFAISFDFKQTKDIPLFVFFLCVCAIPSFARNKNLFGMLTYVMIAFIPAAKASFIKNVYDFFKYIIAVLLIVSLLLWVLVVLFGVSLPYTIIPPLNELKQYNYMSYVFLVIPMNGGDMISNLRFCSVFDEPGVVGTVCLLMLFIENFRFNRWYNMVFLLAGFVSFSFFFYIGLALFVLIKVFMDSSYKKYRVWTVVGIIAFFSILFLNPFMNEMIGSRFEYNIENQKFVGDNRATEALDDYIESIRWTDKYYWGDTDDVIEEFSGSAGIKNAILRYGFVFIVSFFVFFFLFAKRKLYSLKDVLLFILLLFLTLYQRPGFMNSAYLFLFTSAIYVPLMYQEEAVMDSQ